MRPISHPCKLARIGKSNHYRVLHCEHIVLIVPSDPNELRTQCCNCTFQHHFKQGDFLSVGPGPHGPYLNMSRPDDKAPMVITDELEHEKTVKAAKEAIRAVTTDHNVTLEHSAASLRQLRFYIDGQLDQLENGL